MCEVVCVCCTFEGEKGGEDAAAFSYGNKTTPQASDYGSFCARLDT